MAITTRDQLIAAVAASPRQRFLKTGGAATLAGVYQSLWRVGGNPGAAAAGPANGSSAALTRTSTGALPLQAPSNTSYLAAFDAQGSVAGTLLLCDRIAEFGVNAAVNTSQAMGSVTLPARATGLTDIEAWIEVETALGATQTGNITVTYLDQAGGAGTAAAITQFAASSPIGRAQPIVLAAGDTGVTDIETVQLTTASTGKFNIVMRRVLCPLTIVAVADGKNLGYPETDLETIGDNACLELIWLPQGTTAPTVMGGYSVAQG